jgi:SAM-dependent methyltransferase
MGLNTSAPLAKVMDGATRLHRFRYHLGSGFVTREDTVLDAGCGKGYGSDIISQKAKNVIGIDMDGSQIPFNEKAYPHIEFREDNLETCELPDVDVAVSFEVIEHTYKPAEFIKKLKSHVKKYIVVSVPCGVEELIEVDGDVQVKGDSTHHSVFDTQEDLDNMFLDDSWAKLYSFQSGVTYISIYYNKDHI